MTFTAKDTWSGIYWDLDSFISHKLIIEEDVNLTRLILPHRSCALYISVRDRINHRAKGEVVPDLWVSKYLPGCRTICITRPTTCDVFGSYFASQRGPRENYSGLHSADDPTVALQLLGLSWEVKTMRVAEDIYINLGTFAANGNLQSILSCASIAYSLFHSLSLTWISNIVCLYTFLTILSDIRSSGYHQVKSRQIVCIP